MKMNRKMLGIAGIGALALTGGTFAYFSQTSAIDNPFDTAKYGSVVYEDFKPQDGDDWQPGAEVNKDLYVKNTGDRDVVVRVKFEDIWSRKVQNADANGTAEVFKRLDSTNSMAVFQADPYDGETDADQSVVHKYFTNKEKWSSLQDDGYYYYKTKLGAGEDTGKFLDSVRLDAETDMGKMMTQYYYTEESPATNFGFTPEEIDSQWTKDGDPQPASASQFTPPDKARYTAAITQPEEGKLGYSDADYVLRITVETVQATDQAVANVFASAPKDIVADWALSKENLE